jgi:YfiH family protein
LAVTLADCVPVFLTHPSGAFGMLHAGWRGTAAGIVGRAIADLRTLGARPEDCHAHLGPAICGACYEVGPEVVAAVRGERVDGPTRLDLRQALGAQLAAQGVRHVTTSPFCTRCDNARFFSHRAGDGARHIGVIARIA